MMNGIASISQNRTGGISASLAIQMIPGSLNPPLAFRLFQISSSVSFTA